MSARTNREKILATSWHPGGANAIIPVIKKMAGENRVEVVVVGYEYTESIFKQAGILFKRLADYGLVDVSLASMTRLLEIEEPDLVLTGTASQEGKGIDIIEQTITLAARALGIKSVAVLDYWANYSPRFSDERTGEKLDCLPTFIAVMDEVARKDMEDEGFPADKLIITGNPHFDSLSARAEAFTEKDRVEARNKIGLGTKTIFFFAGNMFSHERESYGCWDMDILSLVEEELPNLPNVGLAVRLHPRTPEQDKSQLRTLIGRFPERMRLIDDIDSQTLVLSSDLTLVINTTIAIEAVLMKRPCISLQPGLKVPDPLLLSKKGIIPVGYYSEICKDLLRKAGDADYRKQIMERYRGFTIDGKATERVVKLVYSLLF